MATQICSHCGYEGRGKPVGGPRSGGAFRLLGILTLLPFHSVWKLFGGGGKQCPHCQMPTMVKLNSEAGRIVRRRMDIELGLIQVKQPEAAMEEDKTTVGAFGNERPSEQVVTKRPVDPEQW